MIRANRNLPLVPAFHVKLNEKLLGKDVAAWMVSVTVEDELDLPGMFTLELTSKVDHHGTAAWTDDTRFALGAQISVSFGYGDSVEQLLWGEITALEPAFHLGGPPTLIVRGYDKRHRLNTARRTRSFVDQKDSAIAAQIAAEAKIKIDAIDSEVVHPYVLQAGQTDLDFLLQRAHRMRYELAMDADKLLFRPVKNNAPAAVTLTFDDDLLDFNPCLSLVPVTQVRVLGWDPKEKEPLPATAKASDEVSTMAGEQTGAQVARDLLGDAVETDIDIVVASRAEADKFVKGQFNAMALDYIRGEGTCRGCTGVRAGTVIRIDEIGKRFSGLYYVTSATHSYTRRHGYITAFRVRRNAS